MSWQGIAYAGFTLALGVVFAAIIWRTYRPSRKGQVEAPKFRMLDDENPRAGRGDTRAPGR